MEKLKPHVPLHKIKALVRDNRVRLTARTIEEAEAFGINAHGVILIVVGLEMTDFHRSWTTVNDQRLWQDVYRARIAEGDMLVKLTVYDGVLLIALKELGT